MSWSFLSQIKCGSCGNDLEIVSYIPTNVTEYRDLDTRPVDEQWESLKTNLVKCCKNCGYCGENIESIDDDIRSFIVNDEYQNQLKNPVFPKSANEFICKGLILLERQFYLEAAWAYLHAAWCCDDEDKYIQSKYCRKKAVELFASSCISGWNIFNNGGEVVCLLTDLYRRTENFEIAKQLAQVRLLLEKDEIVLKKLHYEIFLSTQQNIEAHKVENAITFYDDHVSYLDNEIMMEESEEEQDFEDEDEDDEEGYDNDFFNDEPDYERDTFDALTDGQYGDYDDYIEDGYTMDDLDDMIGR